LISIVYTEYLFSYERQRRRIWDIHLEKKVRKRRRKMKIDLIMEAKNEWKDQT